MKIIQHNESYSASQIQQSVKSINRIRNLAFIAGGSYLLISLAIPALRGIWWFVAICLIVVVVKMRGNVDLKRHEKNLVNNQKGLAGEDSVCAKLSTLDDSWSYIRNYSNLNACSGDIDGVLVGPRGIFLIEVKNWHGSFRVSGPDMYKHLANDVYKLYKSPIDQLSINTKKLTEFLAKHGIQTKPKPFVVLVEGRVESFHGQSGIFIAGLENIVSQVLSSTDQKISSEQSEKIISALS